jgi:transcriptional regulator with XRE-family HTH domain
MPAPRKHPPAVITELNIEQLCRAIERERVRRQLRHYQVAAELGVSEATVSAWRRRYSSMSGDAAVRVALFLRRDLRDFARQRPARPAADPAQSDAA